MTPEADHPVVTTTKHPVGAPMIGIAAGVHDMINVISAPPGALPIISSGKNAQDVVEVRPSSALRAAKLMIDSLEIFQNCWQVLSGFVISAHGGHIPVSLPLVGADRAVGATATAEAMVARI